MSRRLKGRRSLRRAGSAARPNEVIATGWDLADISPLWRRQTLSGLQGPSQREGKLAR
jgi:hypothetical protein